VRFCGFDNFFQGGRIVYIPRIDAYFVSTVFDRFDCKIWIEMDVSNERDFDLAFDLFYRFCSLHAWHSHADHFAAGFFKCADLFDSR